MVDDPLAAFRVRFRDRCVEDAVRLRAHLAGQEDGDLEHLVHRLAGSAGAFGYSEVGKAAAAADAVFARGECPAPDMVADLADALDRLAAPQGLASNARPGLC